MLLTDKISTLQTLLAPFNPPPFQIFESPETGYRMRCEFRIWHEGATFHYAMFDADKRPQFIDHFPIAHPNIQALMPRLRQALARAEVLYHKLFQIDFHTTTTGETLVSLIYHKALCDSFATHAAKLAQELEISVIGRSRKQKIVFGRDFVNESFEVNGVRFDYRQYENSFSQPNALICQAMLNWAVSHAPATERDLLELYCGNGNFTLPLSRCYKKVLATEISKSGIKALGENQAHNGIHNLQVARLSAEELTQAFNGERVFQRLELANISIQDYDFGTVFVDPPRAGIDPETLKLLKRFDHIIYISCNPHTLADNLKALCPDYRITHAALFDQFPKTQHLECGVILQRTSESLPKPAV